MTAPEKTFPDFGKNLSEALAPQLPPSDAVPPGLVMPPSIEYREAVRRLSEMAERSRLLREDIDAYFRKYPR